MRYPIKRAFVWTLATGLVAASAAVAGDRRTPVVTACAPEIAESREATENSGQTCESLRQKTRCCKGQPAQDTSQRTR